MTEPRLTCPGCGSHDVTCVPHPTAAGWHVYECQDCGAEGGDHKGVRAAVWPSNWREKDP